MYMFGGAAPTGEHFNDLHAFDLRRGTWSQLPTAGEQPPKMSGQSAVAFGAKIVVFGGMNMAEQMIYNDVWVLDTGMLTMRAQRVHSLQILRSCPTLAAAASPCAWSKPTVKGTPPSERNAHTSCAYGSSMIVFGGSSPITGPINDVYTLDVSGLWHQFADGGALVLSVCVCVCVCVFV